MGECVQIQSNLIIVSFLINIALLYYLKAITMPHSDMNSTPDMRTILQKEHVDSNWNVEIKCVKEECKETERTAHFSFCSLIPYQKKDAR